MEPVSLSPVKAQSSNGVQLSWNNATCANSYLVTVTNSSNHTDSTTVNGTVTSYLFNSLPFDNYTFTVTTIGHDGTQSASVERTFCFTSEN